MPCFVQPIHEVNHCHGPGRGHPCDGGSMLNRRKDTARAAAIRGSMLDRRKDTATAANISGTTRATHASDAYRIRKPSLEEEALLQQAADDWRSNRAYVDNAGNYRIRSGGAATPTRRTKGKIAPWNKLVKRVFSGRNGVEKFHNFADRKPPLQYVRPVVRSSSSRFL